MVGDDVGKRGGVRVDAGGVSLGALTWLMWIICDWFELMVG